MIIGGGGDGLDFPQGDPGALRSAAGRLHAIAGQLEDARGRVVSAASAATAGWTGWAATQFDSAATSTESGLRTLAGYHGDAGDAIARYAAALEAAQHAARQAAAGYSRAQDSYSQGMSDLSAHPPTGPHATSRLDAAQSQLSGDLNRAWNAASTAAANACHDARQAAHQCAARLEEISKEITDTGLHKFVDMIAGPGAVLAVFGVEQQGQGALELWNVIRARSAAEADVMRTAEQSGESSYQALYSWLKFQEAHPDTELPDALQEFWKAAVPAGKVPGGAAGALDVIGKGSLLLAAVGDVAVMSDGQSSTLDRVLSGVNLAGIGAVASGVEVGGFSVLGAVGAGELVTTLIPGVGEVVIAGTAAYLAGEWISQHWGTIEHWAADAGHAITSVVHDGEHLVTSRLHEGEHLVTSGLHEGEHLVTSGLHEGEHLVTSGLHSAEHLLSDLNPF